MSAQLDEQPIDFDLYELEFLGNEVTVYNKRLFLTHYRKVATVHHAAHKTGINRKTAFEWLNVDPAFATAFDDCKQDTADIMETSVYQDALAGNALLKMFWLKAKRPEFRDKLQLDIPQIQDEIRQRMQQLGIDNSQMPQFPVQRALLQKDTTTTDDNDQQ